MGTVGLVSYFSFSIILSYFLASAAKYHVPVLIWGSRYENTKEGSFPSLARVDSDKFFDHVLKNVNKLKEKSTIILFAEETLSVEDFSVQNVNGDGTFPSLKNLIKNYKHEFFPSVENPITVLTDPKVNSYGFTFTELKGNKLSSTHGGSKHKMIYVVNLEDADSKEDRPEMLHRHDEKISKIFNEFAKSNGNVVGILTGRYSSWTEPEEIIRMRRQADDVTERPNETVPTIKPTAPAKASKGVILETKTALIYSKSAPVLKIGDTKIPLENPTNGVHDDREKWQRAVFTYLTPIGKVNLRFRFENTSNYYWSLSQVELEQAEKSGVELLTTKKFISAPYDSSFHTSTPVVFSSGNSSLTFSDMQVQPWKSPSEGSKKFGLAEDDTTFFTPPIWTGLIVTGLISIILMWGVSMILDIRTMDQFDDPKGKTITVNVSE